jgi:hypothetical protein
MRRPLGLNLRDGLFHRATMGAIPCQPVKIVASLGRAFLFRFALGGTRFLFGLGREGLQRGRDKARDVGALISNSWDQSRSTTFWTGLKLIFDRRRSCSYLSFAATPIAGYGFSSNATFHDLITYFALCSATTAAPTALPITSARRFWPLGPFGIGYDLGLQASMAEDFSAPF